MKSLKGIASFVATASCGSFAAAAKIQGVSAVAVSKNVATLERQLGVRLFQRTTRSLKLTAEGQTFYEQCQGPLRELEAAQAHTAQSTLSPEGLVRVTCMPPIATGFILPMLAKFYAQYPKVQIELNLDSGVVDMVADGFDVGIRVGKLGDSSVVARVIAPLPFVVCASPAYLAQRGAPAQLADLAQHNCIRVLRTGHKDPIPWVLQGISQTLAGQLHSSLAVNDFAAAATASAQGLGLCCVPLPLAMRFIRSRQLRPLLTQHISAKLEMYLHYPNRKNLPTRTRVFVDFVLEQLRNEPDIQTPAQALLAAYIA